LVAAPARAPGIFLTAGWVRLVVLNFPVPGQELARFVPRGTELDTWEGQGYLSIVGFSFENCRVIGLPAVGHRRFCEVNLRFYVHRRDAEAAGERMGGGIRRGVVFVQEIVSRPLVAAIARYLYGENYVVRAMRDESDPAAAVSGPGHRFVYCFKSRREIASRWNQVGATAATDFHFPANGSHEQFIVEHYWGYACRRGRTLEYQVAHAPWRVAAASDVIWDCDTVATYGPPWGEWLQREPESVLLAEGSPITVYRGMPL
jgi:uncharacterized protein YqjF (DUF2071 family)